MKTNILKTITIKENGFLHIVFHVEDDETGDYTKFVENFHITDIKVRDHAFPKIATQYQHKDLYPAIDEDPTTTEIEKVAGEVAASELQLNQKREKLYNLTKIIPEFQSEEL